MVVDVDVVVVVVVVAVAVVIVVVVVTVVSSHSSAIYFQEGNFSVSNGVFIKSWYGGVSVSVLQVSEFESEPISPNEIFT